MSERGPDFFEAVFGGAPKEKGKDKKKADPLGVWQSIEEGTKALIVKSGQDSLKPAKVNRPEMKGKPKTGPKKKRS